MKRPRSFFRAFKYRSFQTGSGIPLRISLGLKLILPLLAGLLLVEAAGYISAQQATTSLIRERAGGDMTSISTRLGNEIGASFDDRLASLTSLAEARAGGQSDAAFLSDLAQLSRTPFDAAALYGTDRQPIAWYGNGVRGEGVPNETGMRLLFENATESTPATWIDRSVDPPNFVAVVPVRNPDGTAGGYISASVSVARITGALDEVHYAGAGFAYLVAPDGTVLYAPQNEGSAAAIGPATHQGFSQMGAGSAWLVASEPAGPYLVVMAVPANAVTAEIDGFAQTILVAIGLTSLGIIGALLITVRRTLRPMHRMLDASAKVREGDLSVRVNQGADDEMGQLAASFNSMVESLEAREKQIDGYARDLKRSSEDFQTAVEVLSSAVASTLNPSDVTDVACNECVRILRIDAAYLFLNRDGLAELAARAPLTAAAMETTAIAPVDATGATGVGPVSDRSGPRASGDGTLGPRTIQMPQPETLVDRVLRTGRPVVFNRFALDAVRFPKGLGAGVKSALAVPLRIGERVEGCLLLLDTRSPERFGPEDIPKAAIFAQHIAVGLRNSRYFESAEAERRKYQSVVENANDGILIRVDDQLVFANSALRRMLQDDRFPLPVEEFFDLHVTATEVPKLHARVQRRYEGGREDMMYETEFMATDGSLIPVEISARIIDYDGQPASQMFVRDLRERRRAEEELRRRTDLLVSAEKLAAIGSLAAGVAHEINNPLAFIKGNEQLTQDILVELQSDPEASDALKKQMREISDSIGVNLTGITRIERIVASLRQFAKPSVERQPVDLNGVVESTLILSANKTKNLVQIEKALTEDLPKVLGNADELGQVVLNILMNALEASPVNGGVIHVRTYVQAGDVIAEVADNGRGIPPEVQKRLFDPFFTTKKNGTGLGLAISQRLVTDHGGSLEYKTVPNEGTVFRIRLPSAGRTAPRVTAAVRRR
ncbi:MAG: ATP-binding protein [Thermoplasmatota archaeon]